MCAPGREERPLREDGVRDLGPEPRPETGRGYVRLREVGGRARRRVGPEKAGQMPGSTEDVMRCPALVRRRSRRRRKHSEILKTL